MNPAPFPFNTPVVQLDPSGRPLKGWPMSKDMAIYFQTAVIAPIANAPQFYPSVALTGQNTSLGVTPIPLPSLATGLYRVTTYARITTADAVSSSLTVTISWTESGVALGPGGAAMTGNTTTTVQSTTQMIISDAASPISYSTTYASNTAGVMKYRLSILVESL